MGLRCQATLSSYSLVRMIFEHIFERLVKSAGALNCQSKNNVLMALTYPQIVADQELWSNMSFWRKHAMILLYPGLFLHGSWTWCLLMKFRYTACLDLLVSSLESDLSLDIFLSTTYPRAARLACDSAGRKCRLSAPCAPVGGWRSHRYGEWKMIWNQLLLVSSASRSCQQLCSWLYWSIALIPTFEPIKRPQKNLARAQPMLDYLLVCRVQLSALVLSVTHKTTGWGSSLTFWVEKMMRETQCLQWLWSNWGSWWRWVTCPSYPLDAGVFASPHFPGRKDATKISMLWSIHRMLATSYHWRLMP